MYIIYIIVAVLILLLLFVVSRKKENFYPFYGDELSTTYKDDVGNIYTFTFSLSNHNRMVHVKIHKYSIFGTTYSHEAIGEFQKLDCGNIMIIWLKGDLSGTWQMIELSGNWMKFRNDSGIETSLYKDAN